VGANFLCVYYLAGTAKRAADRDFVATAVKNDSAKNAAEQVCTFAGAHKRSHLHIAAVALTVFFEDSKTNTPFNVHLYTTVLLHVAPTKHD